MLVELHDLSFGPNVVARQMQHLPPARLKRISTVFAVKLSKRMPSGHVMRVRRGSECNAAVGSGYARYQCIEICIPLIQYCEMHLDNTVESNMHV